MLTPQLPLGGRDSEERTDGRSRRWRVHRQQRRTELLKLAREAVAELGAGASMAEIAAQCHTSKSVFYRYFEDKDGLKRELGEYVVDRMARRMTEAVAEAGSFEETLRALTEQYLWQIENSPEVYLFVVSETASTGESPVDRFCQAVAELLIAAHRRHADQERQLSESMAKYWAAGVVGLVRGAGEAWMQPPTSPPCDTTSARSGGTFPGCASATPQGSRPSLEEFVDTVTAWVVSGSRPPHPDRSSPDRSSPDLTGADGTPRPRS